MISSAQKKAAMRAAMSSHSGVVRCGYQAALPAPAASREKNNKRNASCSTRAFAGSRRTVTLPSPADLVELRLFLVRVCRLARALPFEEPLHQRDDLVRSPALDLRRQRRRLLTGTADQHHQALRLDPLQLLDH